MKLNILLAFYLCGILGVTKIVAEEGDPIKEMEQQLEEAKPLVEETPAALVGARSWQKPNYKNQEKALGYDVGTFAIPAGMEERVSFWLDIYTKYTTSQGILHDSQYVHLIYETVDFTEIDNSAVLTDRQKRKQKVEMVKAAKRKIEERLLHLSQVKSADGLTGEELRYWHLFSRIEGETKFRDAASKKRLRFQLGQKDRFEKGLFYSGRYLEEMEKIFRTEGLPIELTRLPFVESSFNVKARSRVGASGVWQFMRSTGRLYLRINSSADERNDPLLATAAAARKMRSNYQLLGTWPLAVTAYNHGPAGMKRMVQKYESNQLVELLDVRKGRFGFASANFYACFLAAIEAEKHADKHFSNLAWDSPLDADSFILSKNVSRDYLLGLFDGNKEKAQDYNPHLQNGVWKGYNTITSKNMIRIPKAKSETFLTDMRNDRIPAAPESKAEYYEIASGETLSEIAQRYGVRLSHLLDANGISDARAVRAGQKLVIPNAQ